MNKTPLEIALDSKKKTCASCPDRVEVKGISYCRKNGKILHPMLLEKPYGECPIEQKRRNDNEK